jgi:hypothetical protein
MPGRDETIAVALSIAMALLMVMVAVIAGASDGPQPSMQGGPPTPGCIEWTDSCVVCARAPEGLACSTPGIACTRGAPRCLRR